MIHRALYSFRYLREIHHTCNFPLQGDGNIRYYEVSDVEPHFTFLNEYRSSSPQRGLGVMPKRGLDVTTCEIYRFYKLHNNNFVEPIAMTVPRRVSSEQNSFFLILTCRDPLFFKDHSIPLLMANLDYNPMCLHLGISRCFEIT